MEEITLNNWDEFGEYLQKFEKERLENRYSSKFLFRGQGNSCWPLESTLERYIKTTMTFNRILENYIKGMTFKQYHHLIFVIKAQIESFIGKNWNILSYPDDFDKWLRTYNDRMPGEAFSSLEFRNTLSYMIYLRHYGFPSPLIDWTSSPYVAAYFAFKNSFHDSKYVSIFVYLESAAPDERKICSDNEPCIHKIGPYVKTDKRHFIQQSQYTICVIHNDEWRYTSHEEAFNLGIPNQDILRKLKIPRQERWKVLKHLDNYYNINDLSLFGSEESLMHTMALREIDFRDTDL